MHQNLTENYLKMPFPEGVSTHKIMFQELKGETNLGKKRTVILWWIFQLYSLKYFFLVRCVSHRAAVILYYSYCRFFSFLVVQCGVHILFYFFVRKNTLIEYWWCCSEWWSKIDHQETADIQQSSAYRAIHKWPLSLLHL